MTDVSDRCPRCGAPLNGASETLCPACLLKSALEAEPGRETRLGGTVETYLASEPRGDAGETRLKPAGSARTVSAGPQGMLAAIGPYRIVRVLGEGGMGVVYLAEQTEPIRRTVALKVIKLGMDTRDVVARFESERQALALMDHPNIARVIDAGATPDGRPFFVMEHVAGVPITDYCDAHRLSTRARIELVAQICGAIQHAHQKGIIHRDLKPSNVLVMEQDGTPTPKIIDFGIAKATDQRLTERTMFTEQGQFMGTPEYMSPEQTGMAGLDIDATTDIYSIGVLMYELLAGALPFEPAALRKAGYAEMQRIIREDEPPKPSTRVSTLGATASDIAERRHTDSGSLRKLLTGDLDWITLKAMEKDRTRRYASASEFAADIARYLNNEPVLASPPSAAYRAQKFVRRNRLAVAAGSLVSAAVIVGLIVSSVLYVREGQQRRRADAASADALARADAEARARAAAEASATAEALARRQADAMSVRADELRREADAQRIEALGRAYVANVVLAAAKIESADPRSAQKLLDLTEPTLRGWEWRHLQLSADSSLATLEAHGGSSTSGARPPTFAFSGDGRRMFWNTETVVQEWDTTSYRALSTHGGFGSAILALSPTATFVVVKPAGSTALLRVVDVESRRSSDFPDSVGEVLRVVVSPTGAQVAASYGDGDVRVWDLATRRRVTTRLPARAAACGPPRQLAFSHDGRRLALSCPNEAGAYLWDPQRGDAVREFRGSQPMTLVFSPDDRRLAIGGGDKVLRVWELDVDVPPLVLEGHTDRLVAVAFSPDGQRMASTAYDKSVRVWDLAAKRATAVLGGFDFPSLTSVAFDPSGRRVMAAQETTGDGEIRVWDARSHGAFVTIEAPASVEALRFGAGGRLLAAGATDGTVAIWSGTTLGTPTVLKTGADSAVAIDLSPSGDVLAVGGTNGVLELWDVGSGRLRRSVPGDARVMSVVFSPTGTEIASATRDGTVLVRNVASGRVLARRDHAQPVRAMAFAAEGRRLIVGSGDMGAIFRPGTIKTAELWEWRTDRVLASIDGREGSAVVDLASHKGVIALAGTGRPGLYIWDDRLQHELRRIGADDLMSGTMHHAAFTSDGRRLVSLSADGTIRLWDAELGDQLLLLRPERSGSGALAVSPDSSRIASSNGSTVYLWQTRPDAEIQSRALVASLRPKADLTTDLARTIQMNRDLAPDVRKAALELVSRLTDDPEPLNRRARTIVTSDSAEASSYRSALRLAEAAARLAPWDTTYTTTLGWAQYRNGEYQRCIQTLSLDVSPLTRSTIVAMARFRLGQVDEPKRLLNTVRSAIAQAGIDGRTVAAEVKALAAEATALIEGRR